MKAIILVAGYATRLYPLTLNTPKALLEIGGKAIIDYIVDEINTVKEIDEIYVVTNHKFAEHFMKWSKQMKSGVPISILDDGTSTEEDRKGAIGDILFTIQEKNINDDMMIIAGDNFFTYKLKDYYEYYKKVNCDCVCVKQWEDKEQLKQFGIALLNSDGKVLNIEEKPEHPKSNTVVFATYIYKKDTVPLFEKYIKEGNKPDAPGNFPAWLYHFKDVYAYIFDGECYDIGTPKSYEEVCKLYNR